MNEDADLLPGAAQERFAVAGRGHDRRQAEDIPGRPRRPARRAAGPPRLPARARPPEPQRPGRRQIAADAGGEPRPRSGEDLLNDRGRL